MDEQKGVHAASIQADGHVRAARIGAIASFLGAALSTIGVVVSASGALSKGDPHSEVVEKLSREAVGQAAEIRGLRDGLAATEGRIRDLQQDAARLVAYDQLPRGMTGDSFCRSMDSEARCLAVSATRMSDDVDRPILATCGTKVRGQGACEPGKMDVGPILYLGSDDPAVTLVQSSCFPAEPAPMVLCGVRKGAGRRAEKR